MPTFGEGLCRLITLSEDESNLELLHVNTCSAMPEGYQVMVLRSAAVPAFSELFYTQVTVNDKVELKGTLNEVAESMREAEALVGEPQPAERIVLVCCGGKQTSPK